MNQYFVKLDIFDGMSFTRWRDKMAFLLTTLKISYVLESNLQLFPEPSDADTDYIKV